MLGTAENCQILKLIAIAVPEYHGADFEVDPRRLEIVNQVRETGGPWRSWNHDRQSREHKTWFQSLSELPARGTLAILAPIFVMMLILIPLIAFMEVERAIGKEFMAQLMGGKTTDDTSP